MTKEDILKSFLSDDLFIREGYLNKGEADKFRWATSSNNNLIEVLKISIEGEVANESENIIEKKINSFLNRQS